MRQWVSSLKQVEVGSWCKAKSYAVLATIVTPRFHAFRPQVIKKACYWLRNKIPSSLAPKRTWYALQKHDPNGYQTSNAAWFVISHLKVWQTSNVNVRAWSATRLLSFYWVAPLISVSIDGTSSQEFPRQRQSMFEASSLLIYWKHFNNSIQRYQLCCTLGLEIRDSVYQTSKARL